MVQTKSRWNVQPFRVAHKYGCILALLILLFFPRPCNALKMEANSINLANVTGATSGLQTINLRQTYSSPPLIFILPAHENAEPSSVRIRNVTNSTFDVGQVEPPGENGIQPATTVHYFAIEAGVHQLPDGTIFEAGSVSTSRVQHGVGVAGAESWETVNTITTFAANPTVLAQIQTMANETASVPRNPSIPWLTAGVNNVTTNSVQLALERSEVNDGAVALNETIAYLFINSGLAGNFIDNLSATVNYETMHTSNTIAGWDDGCYNYLFSGFYAAAPLVIAHGNTHANDDGGWLRRCAALSNSAIWFSWDEDQDQNAERNHPPEEAGVLIFSQAFDADIVPAPVADYHFDECDLSAGVVPDSEGTYDGSVNGAVTTADDAAGGLCSVGVFSGGTVDLSGLPVSTVAGEKTTVMFWMYWDGTNNVMPFGWSFHDLWLAGNRFGFNTSSGDIYGIANATATLANGWHHIAAIFHNGDVSQAKLYIDGVNQVLIQLQGTPNNTRAYVNSSARISGWLANNSYRFSGRIDEVQIHNGEISATQINTVRNNQATGNNYDGSARTCNLCLSPVAEYHFNECSWSGAANEVIDTSGNNYHGIGYGLTVASDAQVCRSGDFTANGIADYVSLNSNAANGLGDFSVSIWFKTTNTGNQALYSGAGADNNEMLLFLPNNTTFSAYINGGSTSIGIPNIADNIWHHMVWTRSGIANCVYLDNISRGCGNIAGKTNPVSISPGGLIIGQEQDIVGGSFDANQDFEGYIDEIRIYDKVLNAAEVNSLFSETLGTCGTCQPTSAEWHFDECTWNGTPGEVTDEQGIANGIRAGDAISDGNGKLCRGGLFDGAGDYVDMGDSLNNVFGTASNIFTITAWIKPTSLTAAQTNHFTRNTFIAKASDSINDNLEIGVNTDGTLHLYLDSRGRDTYNDFGAAGEIVLNAWNFVALVYDAGTVTVRINDNTYTDTTTWASADTFIDNAAGSPFTVGASIHIDNYFTGSVDEVKIYSTALDSAALDALKAETRATCSVCSAPLNEYRFDDCDLASGIVTDSMGGDDGLINGAVTSIAGSALCKAGDFNGGTVDLTGLSVSTVAGDKSTVMFWMNWDGTNGIMPFGWRLHDLWFNSDRFGFNSAASDIYGISGANAKLANSWHHIAAVFVNGNVSQEKIYIDGLAQTMTQQLGTPNNANAYVNANARISGWTANNGYRFSGQIDEVMIFDGEVSAGEIYSIYANEDNGFSYDGTIRNCNLCTTAVGEWHLDECFWDETSGEVIDSGANGYHGTSNSSNTSVTAHLCRSGDFTANGTADYLKLPYQAANGLGDFTISVWIKTANTANQAVLSGAGASDNELLMWFPNNTTFMPFINGTSSTIGITNIADDNWHHLAWTRSGTLHCMYVDTVPQGCTTIAKPNPLIIANGGLILGQEQDSVGGGFDAAQDFEGLIDQLKIYDAALSSGEITTLYNETTAGCNVCQLPIADWQFDECSPAGTITDASGNGYDGSSQGNTDTTDSGILCRTGDLDGAGDYVQLNNNLDSIFGTTNNTFTLSAWLYPTALTAAQTNHATSNTFFAKASDSFNDNLEIGVNPNGTVHIYMDTAGANTYTDFGNAADVALNSWNFIATTYDGNTVEVTINNNTYTDSTTWNGGGNFKNAVNSPVTIGASIHIDNYFTGQIDEVQLYDTILSAANLQTQRNNYLAGNNYNGAARVCGSACTDNTDHISISHDGTAINCQAEPITISAHNYSHASPATTYSGTMTLSTDTGHGDWTYISGGIAANLNNFSNGNATYLFDGTDADSSVVLGLKNTFAETININITDGTINETSGAALAADDPGLVYDLAGFNFLANSVKNAIGNQIAGKPSNIAPGNQTLELEAIRTNDETSACEAALVGNNQIELAYECIDPAGCTTNKVSINGTSLAGAELNYTPVTLNFGDATDTTANFTLQYPDAGEIKLHAQYDLPLDDGASTQSGNYMSGSCTEFIVRPFGFYVDDTLAYIDNGTDCGGCQVAGQDFRVDVSAFIMSNPNQDDGTLAGSTANNGIPDIFEDDNPTDITTYDNNDSLSSNAITGNFTASATLGRVFIQPSGGDDGGALGFTASNVALGNGTGNITDANWVEVGIIAIKADTTGYLTSGGNITGTSLQIGRFRPDRFDVTINEGTVTWQPATAYGLGSDIVPVSRNGHIYRATQAGTTAAAEPAWPIDGTTINDGTVIWEDQQAILLNNNCSVVVPFTYLDEQFSYVSNPQITIKALNTSGNITKNYGGEGTADDFWKLTAPTLVVGDYTDQAGIATSVLAVNDPGTTIINEATDFDGDGIMEISSATFTHPKPGIPVAPFEAAFDFLLSAGSLTDSDNVCYDSDDNGTCEDFTIQNITGTQLRQGRATLSSAFGPETDDLEMPLTLEYYDGITSDFIYNLDDVCTTYDAAADLACNDPDLTDSLACANVASTSVGISHGGFFVLEAPDNNTTGSLEYTLSVDSWLLYDWANADGNNDGPHDQPPKATATFGIYRGNDRIINWQEIVR